MDSFSSRRGDSNARPLRPERSALPTALLLDCWSIPLEMLKLLFAPEKRRLERNTSSQKRVQNYCFFLKWPNKMAIFRKKTVFLLIFS